MGELGFGGSRDSVVEGGSEVLGVGGSWESSREEGLEELVGSFGGRSCTYREKKEKSDAKKGRKEGKEKNEIKLTNRCYILDHR